MINFRELNVRPEAIHSQNTILNTKGEDMK